MSTLQIQYYIIGDIDNSDCGLMQFALVNGSAVNRTSSAASLYSIESAYSNSHGTNTFSWSPIRESGFSCAAEYYRISLSCADRNNDDSLANGDTYYSGRFMLNETTSECPAGQYYASGSGVCSLCPVGMYSEAGATSCSICGDGEYNSATGASSCTACPAGKFLSDNGNVASFHDSADDCSACLAPTLSGV